MKKTVFTVLVLICLCHVLPGAAESSRSDILSVLTEAKTNWSFTSEPVDEQDLHSILEAGVNTASAINEQPWDIAVITDRNLIARLADTPGSAAAPVMILVSVTSSNEMKILDAGLVTQTMQITARILGYATKIETAPARTIRNDSTGTWAEQLGIPADKLARAALFIGHADDSADVLSSSSVRNDFDRVVHFVPEVK